MGAANRPAIRLCEARKVLRAALSLAALAIRSAHASFTNCVWAHSPGAATICPKPIMTGEVPRVKKLIAVAAALGALAPVGVRAEEPTQRLCGGKSADHRRNA
jgi:hypothetical protein